MTVTPQGITVLKWPPQTQHILCLLGPGILQPWVPQCVKPKPWVKTKGGSVLTKPHIQLTLYIYNPGKQKTVRDQIVTGASVAQPLTKSKGESFPTK